MAKKKDEPAAEAAPSQTVDKTRLTREQIAQKVRSGQSVLHKGTLITTEEEIPDDVELAGNTPEARAATRDQLVAQREALDAQIARLEQEPAKEQ